MMGHTIRMKQFILCIFLLVLLAPVASFADNELVRGQVGQQKKIKIYTDEQLDEALTVSDECKAYDLSNTRYDCDCVGMTFLELRRTRGDKAPAYWLRDTARRKCPNAPAMAGKVYTECTSWAPSKRGEDYDAFCKCYGSTFAKIFSKNPTDNLIVTEAQTVSAMQSCNVNAVNVKAQDRDAFVAKLKESKVYDKLFPGAKEDPQPRSKP